MSLIVFRHRVLIEGVKYYAEKPNMIGKTFLRLERDFDKHVSYCRDEPNAQDFLANNDEVRDFFEVSPIRIYISLRMRSNRNENIFCHLFAVRLITV